MYFSFYPAESSPQCRVRVREERRYLRRRAVAISSSFNFALPTPSSAQSRGTTRVSCSRTTWYRAIYGSSCHLFGCCICSTLFFRLDTSPPSGAVRVATFHPGHLSFPRLTPRLVDGPREFFALFIPFVGACAPLNIDEGSPRRSTLSVVGLP